MPDNRQVIAVAGVGDLGKYICEELLTSDDFTVIVLSRRVRRPNLHDDLTIPRIRTLTFLRSSQNINGAKNAKSPPTQPTIPRPLF